MINTLILLIGLIINVALMTLSERKIMGSKQRRIGPNKVGYQALLQPFSDGFKLILKEIIIPNYSNSFLFIFTPYLFFYLALLNWLIIPLDQGISITELIGGGILIIITISELSIYGVLYSGWSSNSKYSLIGSLRSTAQMISYSITLSLIILSIIYSFGTINLLEILYRENGIKLIFPLLPISLLLTISIIAECNRAPFDLPEAESELVAGFMTEYSGVAFAFWFLGEYANMILMSTLFNILFFGFSSPLFFLFLFIWVRASLPRLRFDQLLSLGWIHILPFIIGFIMFLPFFLFLIH
jgi:NADH-quinone oxidoreductase subunit H